MAGSFTVLSHTADTAIAVEADTLEELLAWAATGMCALMYDTAGAQPDRTLELAVEADRVDELVVDLLSELLFWTEVDGVVPCTFEVPQASETRATLVAGVIAAAPELLVGPPIKAVTYHDLTAEPTPTGWRAQIVFDV